VFIRVYSRLNFPISRRDYREAAASQAGGRFARGIGSTLSVGGTNWTAASPDAGACIWMSGIAHRVTAGGAWTGVGGSATGSPLNEKLFPAPHPSGL
jgi:hypothetical protein